MVCLGGGGAEDTLGCPQKRSVFCPAGSRNCGQSGGCTFLFQTFFCLVGTFLGMKNEK